MKHRSTRVRLTLLVALIFAAFTLALRPLHAQNATPVVLDEVGFGLARADALEPRAQTAFMLEREAGDRVANDLQGESGAVEGSAVQAPYGDENNGDAAFPWNIEFYDTGVVSEAGVSVMALPGAMSQEILAFGGMEAGDEPAPEPLAPDVDGVAQAAGTLEPQGMASYVVAIDKGASVQALIVPADDFVLTVAGADGSLLQGDDAGASNFDQIMPASQEYTFKVINFGDVAQAYEFAISVTLGAVLSDDGAAATGDMALGVELVTQYFDALQANDAEQVAALLAPALQIVRATGERYDASNYLDHLPVFEAYEVSNVEVTRDGDVMVVAYTVSTATAIDNGATGFGAPAPRLTIFQQIDGAWKLLAHADFAAPISAEMLAPALAPVAADATVTDADNGGTVQVAAGGRIDVELPGNPTTGYIWQVTANDESILLPIGHEFAPDSDAAGAGGMERFSFHVMAPGEVNLELVNSRPWETDAPPERSFGVTVDAVAEWTVDSAWMTVGMANNGATVTLVPGSVLLVALDGPVEGRWQVVQGDAMILPPLGDWRQAPNTDDVTQAFFQRAFLGAGPGVVDLQFAFMSPDGADREEYALTVGVAPTAPGSSGAVNVSESDAGGESTLVTGDTLVVRLPANPTTGHGWRVVSANDALLPAAGEPVYAVSSDLTGADGVYTFRFLAKAAGEATVQIAEFAPGADDPDKTLDFNATIIDPAPLTGATVTATAEDAGKIIQVTAGDWLAVELESNPSSGTVWILTANDGAVLRLLPESGFETSAEMPGAGGTQHFVFRALAPGEVKLGIGLFPAGEEISEQVFDLGVTVK
ncbi:MAG: protease inhibitor I42 family protein [Caldilinea sp.]